MFAEKATKLLIMMIGFIMVKMKG